MYSTASPWIMRGFEQREFPLRNFQKKKNFLKQHNFEL